MMTQLYGWNLWRLQHSRNNNIQISLNEDHHYLIKPTLRTRPVQYGLRVMYSNCPFGDQTRHANRRDAIAVLRTAWSSFRVE